MSDQRCVQCGSMLPDESQFCPKCGASLGGTLPVDPSSGPRGLWEVLLHRLSHAVAPRYEIERLLGFGGMAGVYLATDTRLGRPVAIKVMSPSLMSDPKQVERFRQEARATAKLSHPNIVTIHEIDEKGGLQYLVMAFIEGRTLSELLSASPEPVDIERGVRWIAQIARALGHAHGFGIVHRDIKPGNILVDEADTALVTDFGIAKVSDEPGLTRTGMMVGTPTYMSPEQCQSGQVAGASDQYALAVLSHHILAGSPPFSGGTMTVLHKHVSEMPEPLGERREGCPPHVARAIDRALAKAPDDRWPSMEAFLAALEGEESTAASDALGPSRSRPLAGTARARSSGHSTAIWLGGGGVLVAAAAAAVFFLGPWTPNTTGELEGPAGPPVLGPAGPAPGEAADAAGETSDPLDGPVDAGESDPDGASGDPGSGPEGAPDTIEPEEDPDPPDETPVGAAPPEDPPDDPPAPTSGDLRVTGTLPPGARLTGRGPDGTRALPLRGGPLEVGDWTLTLTAPGYRPLEFDLAIAGGDTFEWSPSLVADPPPAEDPPDPDPEPPSDPGPDLEQIRAQVGEAVTNFVSAFETRSLANVLARFPTAPADWQAEYRTLVEDTENIRDLETAVEGLEHVATQADRAEVRFTLAIAFTNFRNQRESQSNAYTAVLVPAESGWQITSLETR